MNVKSTTIRALLCVALLSGITACDSESPASTAPTTGSTSTPGGTTGSSSATTSPSPTDDQGRAVEAVVAYWAAIDAASSDPSIGLDSLAAVARKQALAQWQTTIATNRAKKLTQRGRSAVTDGQAMLVGSRSVRVVICLDVSDVDVVDASGKSVVAAGRPDRQSYAYTVDKATDGFYVTEDLLKGAPCGA